MFKFTIIFGCALLATLTRAAVLNVFDTPGMVSHIDDAIKQIRNETKNFGKSIRAVNAKSIDSAYHYMNTLKISMNATLDLLKSQVDDLEKSQSEAFKNNSCGEYIEEIIESAPAIQDAMDGCTLIALLPSAHDFSEAFDNVAKTIETLEGVKAWVATCKDGMCDNPEGRAPITDAALLKSKIEGFVSEKVIFTLAMLRHVYDSYTISIADTNAVLDCINNVADYDEFVKATSYVLLETTECLASA